MLGHGTLLDIISRAPFPLFLVFALYETWFEHGLGRKYTIRHPSFGFTCLNATKSLCVRRF